jgi:hypothetical protein
MRPGSMNEWNYTEGNPTNHVDPSGSTPEECANQGWSGDALSICQECEQGSCHAMWTYARLISSAGGAAYNGFFGGANIPIASNLMTHWLEATGASVQIGYKWYLQDAITYEAYQMLFGRTLRKAQSMMKQSCDPYLPFTYDDKIPQLPESLDPTHQEGVNPDVWLGVGHTSLWLNATGVCSRDNSFFPQPSGTINHIWRSRGNRCASRHSPRDRWQWLTHGTHDTPVSSWHGGRTGYQRLR